MALLLIVLNMPPFNEQLIHGFGNCWNPSYPYIYIEILHIKFSLLM